MIKQVKNIVLILALIIVISCGPSKDAIILESEFVKYLKTINIDRDTIKDFKYFENFLEYKKKQKQQLLLQDPYLKVNKVYVYQGPNVISFCVFSDDENEYMNRVYKVDTTFLTASVNGIVNLNKKIKLEFLGNLELKDSIIKISRNTRALSGKEWDECDVGWIQGDTIRFIENYDTKKYKYKKKWLSKTYKTNYKLIYQPNLKATRYEADKTHNPYYLIEGSFKIEKNE